MKDKFSSFHNLIEPLQLWASSHPHKIAFRFLGDGKTETGRLSYSELNRQSQTIGDHLRTLGLSGEPIILLYPPGLEFIGAFLGSMYNQNRAIPLPLPRVKKSSAFLQHIVSQTRARAILSTGSIISRLKRSFDKDREFQDLLRIATDQLPPKNQDCFKDFSVDPTSIAYLQYTSGSTSEPKGVMVSHRNVLHNLQYIHEDFGYTPENVCVTWLPHFHDMGLVNGILQPLVHGIPCVVLPPMAFVQWPIRWLQAISNYRGTHSGGPNFAYDLCVQKISMSERSSLDLRSWAVAVNGAEPISSETLNRFAKTFEPCGFRFHAFTPGYGLAEATLKVSTCARNASPVLLTINGPQMDKGIIVETALDDPESRTLVGCGTPGFGMNVVIVDPHTLKKCPPGHIGEIWVSGPSVTKGYWNREEETRLLFQAHLAETDEGPFLRTGDLGFLMHGQLFIAGRLKDLIIIRGQNYYPQDIERVVESCDSSLSPGSCIAFSVPVRNEERLVVVQGLDRQGQSLDVQDIEKRIRQNVGDKFDVSIYGIVFVKIGSIPKTSSGKLARQACRTAFLSGTLDVVWSDLLDDPHAYLDKGEPLIRTDLTSLKEPDRTFRVQSRIRDVIAKQLHLAPHRIDLNLSLPELGVDSLRAAELKATLEQELGITLPLSSFLDGASIKQLSSLVLANWRESERRLEPAVRSSAWAGVLYPLSAGQKAMWFLHQMNPANSSYHVALAARIRTNMDPSILDKVLQMLVDRHPILRTTFTLVNDQPVQEIQPNHKTRLEIIDASSWDSTELKQHIIQERDRPFDLKTGPVFRAHLFLCPAHQPIVLLTAHHIVMDLWSLTLLMDELRTLYSAQCAGQEITLPRLDYSYFDYVRWEQEMLDGPEGRSLEIFGEIHVGNNLPLLNLPTDRPRPTVQTANGGAVGFQTSHDLAQRLRNLAQSERVTVFSLLLASFYVLLHRYTGQSDLVVGSPTTGRSRPEFERIVGYFANPLVLRADLSGNPTFRQFLDRISSMVLCALDHQDYPFERLVERAHPQRDPSYPPVFQAMFVWEQVHRADLQQLTAFVLGEPKVVCRWDGLELEPFGLEQRASQVDLTLVMTEVNEQFAGSFQFNSDLFDAATVARMAEHFRHLLESVVTDPERAIGSLSLISQPEYGKILVDWNDTSRPFPEERCLHHYVEEHAKEHPEAIALRYGSNRLTYHELNIMTNQLAHFLQAKGVGPEIPVGLCAIRTPAMVVGLLGILKAGGAYVPLDPALPKDRLSFMLQDTQTRIVLTSRSVVVPASQNHLVIDLDSRWQLIAREGEESPNVPVTPHNLAYVLYTSGTTGRPKGVMIEHRGLNNLIQEQFRLFDLPSESRVLQFSSLSFDASLFEITMALARGATLVLGTPDALLPGRPLLQFMRDEGITAATLPPSALETLPSAHLPELRLLNIAGEVCSQELVERWSEGRAVFNLYGPTETTIWATYARCSGRKAKPPVGRPISNVQIYILDRELQPVPIGVSGEICIGGVGLARGYLNLPDLTSGRFISNPFQPGTRLYKTGDSARYLPDGNIDFLGRIDHQVKIRGYRIELGEIEAALLDFAGIKEAVVLPEGDRSNPQYLNAFVVAADDQSPVKPSDIQKFLRSRLPAFMLPSRVIVVDRLPRLPSGKIDRYGLSQLAVPGISDDAGDWPPHGPVEESLAEIWREVLALEFVGVKQNFFELGGHSLLVTQVMSRIRDVFQVELPLRAFFQNPTITGLCERILEARQGSIAANTLTLKPRDGQAPLSFSQERMWFLHQLEDCGPAYTIPAAVRLTGSLKVEILEQSLNEIVRRHEILRTGYSTLDGRPYPAVSPSFTITMTPTDLSRIPSSEQEKEVARLAREHAQLPFDLAHAPLFRLTLLRLSETDHVLFLMMHHIISDAWSLGVFFKELGSHYAALIHQQPPSLPDLPLQYSDFSYWHRKWLTGPVLDSQLVYWKGRLADAPGMLDLPTDRPRPAQQTFHGALEMVELPAALSHALTAMSRQEGVTLFMLLLAAFKALLYRYSGQEDILVGTPVANRNWSAVEGLIGTFVNTLVLRTDLSNNPTFRELLSRVKETALAAYDHQDLPFEKLVEVLQPDRDLSRSPLFQIMFTVPNVPMPMPHIANLSVKPWFIDRGAAQFDLTLSVVDTLDQARWIAVEYNTDLFNRETIIRMLGHFQNILRDITGNPERRLWELSMFSSPELDQLLVAWNTTTTPYPENVCLHELIETQVTRDSNAPAVIFNSEQLTYGQLDQKANQLAARLREYGVGPEVLVGIFMDRSIEMLIGLLGVLKAGGAYVPLDPTFPHKRLAFMVEDAAVALVLTKNALRPALTFYNGPTLCLDTLPPIQTEHARITASGVEPSNLAYVIYTSGSTGTPKGVMIPHKSVVNFLTSMRQEPGLDTNDTLLAVTSLSFDIAGLELFLPLIVGARVVIADQETVKDGRHLAKLLTSTHASIMQATPATWRMLLDSGWQGSSNLKVLCGGEQLPVALAKQLLNLGLEIWNLYGPTETTIWSTCHRVLPDEEPIPLGRPIANTFIYLLDPRGKPVPIGVPGELYIGGAGLARGYLNRPELTESKFLPNPFVNDCKARLYKTGDLARFRADGVIEYLGRLDYQVKIRGYRIELSEVEHALERHPNVRQAVVMARETPGKDRQLVAYAVLQGNTHAVIPHELRSWLKEFLPDYMVPSDILLLDALPLTPNGKVDRRNLPEPKHVEPSNVITRPTTPMEEKIAEIWTQILHIPQIGVDQNFFEIGGHSLLATQVLARLHERFRVELPLRCIFEAPTITELAKYVEAVCWAAQPISNPLRPFEGEFEENIL